jgi:outer membrane lipoprotein-sorting protein
MYLRTATSSTPMMFRFEYFRPTRHEIVTDGRTLWTYLPENRQVIQSDISFFNRPGFNPDRDQAFNFLQGLARISKDFQINFSPQRQDVEGNYILELNPRRSMASIRQLFVVVNRDAVLRNAFMKQGRNFAPNQPALLFPIISTTVLDHQGNSTIMEFTNIVTNSRLSNFLFNFVVPAGVQVVRPPVGP